ncbi:MAG: hypothetical protein KC505_09160 [Myxococcales bacterium]|nr:hypothetical protein [Myxococcales bacterium]USN51643.1 MAG: hypothetical protein H6731_04325 [Myxococcales bacterium]
MPAKYVVFSFLIVASSACQHLSEFFKPLTQTVFKAIVHGAIKGTAVHCEKSIEVVSDRWQVMCKIDDVTDIKYRTIKLNDDESKFEILIDKQKGEERKTIAAPTFFVSRKQPAELIAESQKSRLEFRVERIR